MFKRLRSFVQRKTAPEIEAQVSEDTCKVHGIFLCDKCFDFTPVRVAPRYMAIPRKHPVLRTRSTKVW